MSIDTRVPPQALEAEQSVLGAIILDNDRFEAVADIIGRDDFYRESHACIWDAIVALMEAHQPVDPVTLTTVLRASGKLEAIGGPGYLAELESVVPAPSLAARHAHHVREKTVQRTLLKLADEITERVHEPSIWDGQYTETLIADAEAQLARLSGATERNPAPPKAQVLDRVLSNLAKGIDTGIPTGFPKLDRNFGGFNRGHLTIPAARTSRGKTALASNFALNAVRAGYHVAYFSLEMSADEMWNRFIALAALVDAFRTLHFGYKTDKQRHDADMAGAELKTLPLEIRDPAGMTPRMFRLECRRLKREMDDRLDLAVIDYLGLMRGNRHERDEWREKAEVVRQLKLIASEMNIAIVLVCQLNRQVGEHERPTSAHLRDTGAAEEHASNILFLWEPSRGDSASELAYAEPTPVKLAIEKQRNGPSGLVRDFEFIKCFGKFNEL